MERALPRRGVGSDEKASSSGTRAGRNQSEAVGSRQSPDVEPEQREAFSRKREPRVQAWAVREFRVLEEPK